MAGKKTDKVVVPKSYNSLEALEAEANIKDVEPYSPRIATDENGKPVHITFRPFTELTYDEIDAANTATVNGDELTFFKLLLDARDLAKVRIYGLKAYQMGLLMGACQRYYNDAYAVGDSLGNSSDSDD